MTTSTDQLAQASTLPVIRRRTLDQERFNQALGQGMDPLAARILCARPCSSDARSLTDQIHPATDRLTPPQLLPDMDKAARRLASAIITGEIIALETDHDVDGVSSHAVLKTALIAFFSVAPDRVQSYIGHRLKEGYGLSDSVADRMLASDPVPDLVVTADNGSADEPRIARLAEHGIDTIVTDHHAIPAEGIPNSAVAVVNPSREDSAYGDPFIAGCMVAWLLVVRTARVLVECGHLDQAPPDGELLDFVAIGTVADCVSMSRSINNRIVVRYGLEQLNRCQRAPWRVIRAALCAEGEAVDEKDLGWGIGPRINARGRLDDAMAGVQFLLSQTDAEAYSWWALLDSENTERKSIERDLKEDAMAQAGEQVESKCHGIAVFLSDGHPGVHGIVASRVVEAYGRPTVCLSPVVDSTDRVTGSARAVPGFHVKAAMDEIAQRHPDLLLKHGGHEGAGGLTLRREDVARFQSAWEQAVARSHEHSPLDLHPVILTDGELGQAPDLELIERIELLAPYGREFERPIFEGEARVLDVKAVGDGTHLKLTLEFEGASIAAIWFGARTQSDHHEAAALPVHCGDEVAMVFAPALNRFRGQVSVQLEIKTMWRKQA